MEGYDFSLIDWSRAQFALTALYHWIFVPLTLGITFIIAFMETIYYRTGRKQWKDITKFWMKVFAVNFAVGVATGLILEFEFGTNWSNYSWFVGDIFGTPLAVEGIMAFFMETTFIAVMFFGWNRVSPRFHLASTWLVAIGSNLSALWILVANAWMQDPAGMVFNPETARNEMVDFWAVLFSPTAINKFLHTVASGYVTASVVVVGISSWFLLKKRHVDSARKSILVASVFGLVFSVFIIGTGHKSAQRLEVIQPMKLAAIEALVEGSEKAPLTLFGLVASSEDSLRPYAKRVYGVDFPGFLSWLTYGDASRFVPGIEDLLSGNKEEGIISSYRKIRRGKIAQNTLAALKDSEHGSPQYESLKEKFYDPQWVEEYFSNFGYGYYYDSDPAVLRANAARLVPNIPLTFYSFRIMVYLGGFFVLIFALSFWFALKNRLEGKRWFFYTALWSIPLVYLCSMSGWVVTEVGRQPWVIQDLMPTLSAVSQVSSGAVQTTFWLFAATFTVLLIAEIRIMISQVKKGINE